MALVTLSGRRHLRTISFWKESKSVFHFPGSSSRCGSELSKIFLKPSAWFLNSSENEANFGSTPVVSMSFQDRMDTQSSQGLGTSLGLLVPPANRKRHSSYRDQQWFNCHIHGYYNNISTLQKSFLCSHMDTTVEVFSGTCYVSDSKNDLGSLEAN